MNSMFSENSVRVQADSSTEMAEVEARYSQEEKEIYTVLMTTVLWHSLKSARLILPVPFFFLKIVLAIEDFLGFHTNCEIICSRSAKNPLAS